MPPANLLAIGAGAGCVTIPRSRQSGRGLVSAPALDASLSTEVFKAFAEGPADPVAHLLLGRLLIIEDAGFGVGGTSLI